jgi:amino-acid N-acetyltransferase
MDLRDHHVSNLHPMIVPASVADVQQIEHLLAERAPDTVPVAAAAILDQLARFRVARSGTRVVATAALKPLDTSRLELRSVAVAPSAEGLGLGTAMVRDAQRHAAREGRVLACVTLHRSFFSRLGFEQIPLESMPPKPEREQCPADRERTAMQWIPAGALSLALTSRSDDDDAYLLARTA